MEDNYFERQHKRYLKNSRRRPETGLGCLMEIAVTIALMAIGVAFARSIIGWQLDMIPQLTHFVEWILLHFKLVLLAGVVIVVVIVFVAWRRDGEFL